MMCDQSSDPSMHDLPVPRPHGGGVRRSEAEFMATFWGQVDFSDARGCWVWTGGTNAKGYGKVTPPGGHQTLVHRLAYTFTVGPIPDGKYVLHTCDNPPCVRPSHLWLGTIADNNADMVAKGRHVPRNRGVTHCVNGHEYTPENTRVTRAGWRSCRVCARELMHNRRGSVAYRTKQVPTRCQSPLGFRLGAYRLISVPCQRKVGVRQWFDHTGVPHAACADHIASMKSRWPEADPPEPDWVLEPEPEWLHETVR